MGGRAAFWRHRFGLYEVSIGVDEKISSMKIIVNWSSDDMQIIRMLILFSI